MSSWPDVRVYLYIPRYRRVCVSDRHMESSAAVEEGEERLSRQRAAKHRGRTPHFGHRRAEGGDIVETTSSVLPESDGTTRH